ncbi:hypothetical protein L9F63_022980 [Diploptera punctata]|uniref:Uncharacterized protein n=1 Tax=Diploptera punctata TaxID=6984 RepID=A0AAD7ZLF7_DIPPU|nr:hypothetical protein L9F63_022980 [Diploptera punctata]
MNCWMKNFKCLSLLQIAIPTTTMHGVIACGALLHLSSSSSSEHFLKEWASSETWMESHVSDHSGMQYRQFLLSRLIELKHPSVEEIVEKAKNSLHQLLSSCLHPSNRAEENIDIAQYP